jgi:hypothetical protein
MHRDDEEGGVTAVARGNRRRLLAGTVVAALALWAPALALGADAQLVDPAAEAPHLQPQADGSPARLDAGYRFRFGISFISGETLLDDGPHTKSTLALLGLDLRLGVQINDLFAAMFQFSAAFVDLRAAVLFEVTPTRYFSVGVGLGFNSTPIVEPLEGCGCGPTGALMMPVRLAFNVPLSTYEDKHRTSISLELNLMPGYINYGPPADLGHPFELGVIGGIGFELY